MNKVKFTVFYSEIEKDNLFRKAGKCIRVLAKDKLCCALKHLFLFKKCKP